jgi:hypothetical protein
MLCFPYRQNSYSSFISDPLYKLLAKLQPHSIMHSMYTLVGNVLHHDNLHYTESQQEEGKETSL